MGEARYSKATLLKTIHKTFDGFRSSDSRDMNCSMEPYGKKDKWGNVPTMLWKIVNKGGGIFGKFES